MDPFIETTLATPYPRTSASSRTYRPALTGVVLLCIILGATGLVAAIQRPSVGAAAAGVAVTDGWAHSPITRLGSASGATAGMAVTDGWAHSPVTRLGSADAVTGVAVTDGWAHSPITRGGDADARAARLRTLAALYEAQDFAAEARSR
jgi:hypothetical protein